MGEKKCPHCDIWKTANEFYSDKSKKDGLSSWCRSCCKSNSRKRYAENPEKSKCANAAYIHANRSKSLEHKRRYRERHAEKLKEKNRLWRIKNRRLLRERDQRWREENREHLREQNRIWVEQNRARHQENQRRWRRNNPQASINYATRRRVAIGDTKIGAQEWRKLMLEYEFRCFYCDEKLTVSNRSLDHIIPLTKGGQHHIDNLIPCCRSCNSSKGNRFFSWMSGLDINSNKRSHLLSRLKKVAEIHHIEIESTFDFEAVLRQLEKIFERRIDGNSQNS